MTNEETLKHILAHLEDISYIKPESIPDIDLYMDQVTTFMDEHLKKTKRSPEDKVLTKTMINNYAKNNLLPAPAKKRYSKEHILLLIFIYYFKNLLSFHDIEQLFAPITKKHFANPTALPLEDIYREVFALEAGEMAHLKEDVTRKFEHAQTSFQQEELDSEDRDYLQMFAFICELSFDVYLKKQMIEAIIDAFPKPEPKKKK